MLFPAHRYLFDVIKDSLQFIQADITSMMSFMSLQVLFNFIVLLKSESAIWMFRGSSNIAVRGRARGLEVDIISQL